MMVGHLPVVARWGDTVLGRLASVVIDEEIPRLHLMRPTARRASVPVRSIADTRREVAASFATPAARLTGWFRIPLVFLLALIGPVVVEPRLNVGVYRLILVGYAAWAVGACVWAYRRPIPRFFGWVATVVDLLALVLLAAAGNGPTTYLQPFFLIQPIIVILQLRPLLTAAVGLFIAGGYAAVWLGNLGQDGGPGIPGVVWLHFGLLVWLAAVTTASTALLVGRSASVLTLMRSRQQLIAESISIEERERARLAEELHDGPLQNLIAARRNLEDIADLAPEHPLMLQTDELLHSSAAQLRGTVTVLHPQVLAQVGLSAALEELALQHQTAGRLMVHQQLEDVGHPPGEALIYSTARELLSNVDKHARADNAWVTLTRDRDGIRLTVEDDGVGIDETPDGDRRGHIGLDTHRLRVANAGGRLWVGARQGFRTTSGGERVTSGTAAVLTLPTTSGTKPEGWTTR